MSGQPAVELAFPDRIETWVEGRTEPEWVAPELLFRDGQIQWALLPPDEKFRLEFYLDTVRQQREIWESQPAEERGEEPCIITTLTGGPIQEPAKELDGQVEGSTYIFAGKVVAIRQGLRRGLPRSLVQLEVEEVLKSPYSTPRPVTLYLTYPEASFRLAGELMCARGPRYPIRPVIGKRLLVFSRARIPLDTGKILEPADEDLFFETAEGKLSLPSHYGEVESLGEALSFDLLRARVGELLVPRPAEKGEE